MSPGSAEVLLQAESGELSNLRVFRHDAIEVLAQIADESFDEIFIFFPDPWPKKRHHKRRAHPGTVCRALDEQITAWRDTAAGDGLAALCRADARGARSARRAAQLRRPGRVCRSANDPTAHALRASRTTPRARRLGSRLS